MRDVNKEEMKFSEPEVAVKTISYKKPIAIMIVSSAILLALMAFFFYFDIIAMAWEYRS